MFDPVAPQVSFPELERELLEFWKRERVFERSVEESRGKPQFTFYEGPPTANGIPHWGHVLTRVAKDVVLRYRTMCGYHVPRRAGWDTHGLPVEVEVQKEFDIPTKEDVERFGIEKFTRRCIESVWRYIDEWERMSARVGFWYDPDGYATYHRYYVESVWWALSTLFKQGKLYQGYKSVWWWPQGGTALSQGEVGEGYREVDDPAVVVRFRLEGGASVLAWTTTPWTLPSNIALAVAAKETYVEAEQNGEKLILAKALAGKVLGEDFEVLREFPGSELVGRSYEPLYSFRDPGEGKRYEVGAGDFVTLDSGTGVVHCAPAFGEDDYRFGQENGFAFLQLVEPDGRFAADCDFVAGMNFKEADKPLIRDLKDRGLLYHHSTYRHDYPFSPRAESDPLIQYARKSWFIRTSTEKDKVVANNSEITWQPAHIRDGRMGDFLRNNVDWAISRERWWGTPLPIWINDETGAMDTVGSIDEILERNAEAFAYFEKAKQEDPSLDDALMVHKPWIDEVTWRKEGEPGVYRRVPEVIDCWFDAGSMPFAQWGYPHRNKEKFEAAFPANFITEAIDQTRGWWNAMLQISTLMFPEAETPHPFKSCVVLGHITDEKGKKLSKRYKNYEPPMEALEQHSADAVRWALFVQNVPGIGTRFGAGVAKDAARELLLKVWNVLSFFTTYARIDGWDPRAERPAVESRHTLDRWVLAETEQAVRDVHAAFERLETHTAARRVQALVDGVSNWYVRRSRPRFWAEGDGDDKRAAFSTLYEVLCELSRLLAPLTPFIADTLHRKLVLPFDESAPVSVHLCEYPKIREESAQNAELRRSMALVRDLVALGLQVRSSHNLKVRQPLSQAIVVLAHDERLDAYTDAIREELNVKEIVTTDEPGKYVEFEIVPNFRALGPKLGKKMPLCKKALQQADGAALYEALDEKGEFPLEIDGEPFTLTKDEIQVRLKEKEGYAASGEHGRVIVLDTHITPELRLEGLARETVNRIQTARKTMDLAYEARIKVTYQAEGELAEAIAAHREWIAGETLSVELAAGTPAGEVHETAIEESSFKFGVE